MLVIRNTHTRTKSRLYGNNNNYYYIAFAGVETLQKCRGQKKKILSLDVRSGRKRVGNGRERSRCRPETHTHTRNSPKFPKLFSRRTPEIQRKWADARYDIIRIRFLQIRHVVGHVSFIHTSPRGRAGEIARRTSSPGIIIIIIGRGLTIVRLPIATAKLIT